MGDNEETKEDKDSGANPQSAGVYYTYTYYSVVVLQSILYSSAINSCPDSLVDNNGTT
jgi:hypothetical protein